MRGFVMATAMALTPGVVSAADGHDAERATSYDDGWEAQWVDHCRAVLEGGAAKTDGFVLQIGDSITHSNPYSQWPRYGEGKTPDDEAFFGWSPADVWGADDRDADSTNGWYLAAADTSGQRGMTASSGIDTLEYLTGDGNGGAAMPAQADPATARGLVADGATYGGNLHIGTVAAAFSSAQIAVVMLGTNDVSGGRDSAEFTANLVEIVDELEGQSIVVVLSTIPPHYDAGVEPLAQEYNDEIVSFAMERGLPLIDFHAEIVARQPDGGWNGTLLQLDDVHPSGSGGGHMSSSDPYEPAGVAAEHCTGDAAANVGYLLRSWLTVQKLKEVRAYVVDGVDPPGGGESSGTAGESGDDTSAGDGTSPGDASGSSADTAGTGGTASSATMPGSATANGTSGPGTGGPVAEDDTGSDGCGCSSPRPGPIPLGLVVLLAIVPLLRRRG